MKKISIIIPVYNEEKTVKEVLEKLASLVFDKEIIVVNDGSTDNTADVLKTCSSLPIMVVTHPVNKGKGAALISGIACVSGEVVTVQDADLEYNPEELMVLAEPIINDKADIIFGSRFLKKNPCVYRRFYYGNKIVSLIISLIVRKRISDSYTCYKVFRKEVIKSFKLTSRGFEIEAELSVYAASGPYRFIELPISYSPRTVQEGKKIDWKDAVKGVYTAVKTRFRV